MRISKFLALGAFLGLVPGTIAVAYYGYWVGLYPYAAIPIAFAVAFVVVLGGLFAVLPVVREHLG